MIAHDIDRPSGVYRRTEVAPDVGDLLRVLYACRFEAKTRELAGGVVLLGALIRDLDSGLGVRGELLGLLRREVEREPGGLYALALRAIDAASNDVTSSRRTG